MQNKYGQCFFMKNVPALQVSRLTTISNVKYSVVRVLSRVGNGGVPPALRHDVVHVCSYK